MSVEVKIKGQVITAQYGTLGTGDILRCSQEFADHLVNDCCAAEYLTVAEESSEVVTEEAKSKAVKIKKEG